jgi:hypothetical protein
MRKIILIMLTFFIAITLIGCGATSGGTPTARTYIGALAKGDLVSFTMNPNGTFEFENSTVSLSVTGKYRTYTEPQLNVSCYEAYDLYINGAYSSETAFFKELPEIAIVAYIPGNSGDSEVAVFTYQTTPVLDGSLDGEYHFLNVVTSNKSTSDVEIGKYLISGSGVIGTINSFANPLGSGTQFSLTLSPNGYYIDVNPAGYKVSLTPAGVMIIDHGANNGMSVGNKVPPASYGDDIIGTYFGITSGGENLVKVIVTSSSNMSLSLIDLNTSPNTLHELPNRTITEISPGLYEATLGIDSTGYNCGVIKWTMNSQGTFFGIKTDGQNNPGQCEFNVIGLKIQ